MEKNLECASTPEEGSTTKSGCKKLIQSIGMQKIIVFMALIAIYVFFSVFSEAFRSTDTLVSIFEQNQLLPIHGCLRDCSRYPPSPDL